MFVNNPKLSHHIFKLRSNVESKRFVSSSSEIFISKVYLQEVKECYTFKELMPLK